MPARRFLVVEDEPAIRQGLVDALEFQGHEVRSCEDGEEALKRALGEELDLVLLDLMLPNKSGLEVLQEIRRLRPTLPVILVTALGSEQDRIRGLELGADDYVVKPFSAGELLARVGAVLRRSAERPRDQITRFEIGGRTIDLERREVRGPEQQVVALSEKESDLLRYFCQNPGRTIERDELLRSVWGLDPDGVRRTRTIDMHIARLREKLGDRAESPWLIATVRGRGYQVQEPRPVTTEEPQGGA
ncbi:MAG: response regulator transcription factor [Planctomycetota bacterium]